MAPDVVTVVIVALITVGIGFLLFTEPLARRWQRHRRVPVTDSNRAMRDRRANVVRAMDATTVAYALGPYDAELRGLQHWVDRLAQNDRKDADR